MIRNYIKIAFRNLRQQKTLSLINIGGLSIGLACFTLFLLFAIHAFSFDRFHKNANNIYRVIEWYDGFPGREPAGDAFGGVPLGPAMQKDLADVEGYARFQTGFDEKMIKVDDKVFRSKLSFTDPQMLSIFSFELLDGTTDALKDPHNIIVTKSKAIELFGSTNVIGRRVEIKNDAQFEPFTVGAVLEDIPGNSSINFGMAGSFEYLLTTPMGKEAANNWHIQIGSETYVKLRPDSRLMTQPGRMAQFRKKYYPGEEEALIKDKVWSGKGPLPVSFRLQPLRQVHTQAKIGGLSQTIDPKYIWILVAIAGGILLIACINFTTLAIGRSAGRAKEVGVRKVMGGQRKQLVYQFLTESFLLSVISAIVACLLAVLLLPLFNKLSGVKLDFSFNRFPELLGWLAALVVTTGLIAGIYPALILSGFSPISVLKSKVKLGGSNFFTRSLVTLQFVLSISLIIATIVILQQLRYMRDKNIGFNRENIVAIDAQGVDGAKVYPLFKQKLESNTAVLGVAASEMGLGEGTGLMGTAFLLNDEMKGVIFYPVDQPFIPVMGMKMIAGRNFDPSLSIDTTNSIIVNETFLRDFNLTKEQAIGHTIQEASFGEGKPKSMTIIGVVSNFNFSKLNEKVRAQMFNQPPVLAARKFFVRIRPGDPSHALSQISAAWKAVVPELPVRYSFIDEDFNRFYESEQRWSNIIGYAGFICILLGCLGLFGLASLAAANRTKEIGIRKVLGASATSIVRLLAKDFLLLVVIAMVIAVPIAWWGMTKWLQDYEYRIHISAWVFVITGILAILVALLTVAARSLGTALSNPVKSLRTE